MQTLELNRLGVVSINETELSETNGGMLGLLTLPLAGFLVGYLYEKVVQAIK